MNQDSHEPLGLYSSLYQNQHLKNVEDFWDELVTQSGVDADANAATVRNIHALESTIADLSKKHDMLSLGGTLCVIIFVVATIASFFSIGWWLLLSIPAAIISLVFFIFTILPKLRENKGQRKELTAEKEKEIQAGYEHMRNLNSLYDWDIPAKLAMKTMPLLTLDPYFSKGRLEQLHNSYGWNSQLGQDISATFSQSGAINGSPFVFASTLNFEMGSQEYTGSLHISWQETKTVRDSNGSSRRVTVTRHQTLHASLEAPKPTYSTENYLVYGNATAPELSFSRNPSHLSGTGNGWFDKFAKKKKIKELEKFSRNLTDDSQYTILANRDFEALFHATNRNDERAFRLLFTPLAQQQMLALLNDKKIGYGDNFSFVKSGTINWIIPEHLDCNALSANPNNFSNHNLGAAWRHFVAYNTEYFKSIYFSLAPLLCIPLYQHHQADTPTQNSADKISSSWEHEAIANFHGEAVFKHPDCITRSILKTERIESQNGVHTIAVTAHGFCGYERITHFGKWGGDGRYHQVPVKWIEYEPVSHTAHLSIVETEGISLPDYKNNANADSHWSTFFRNLGVNLTDTKFRRSIVSYLKP